MATATLTSKGQITIPKEIREHLNLKPGDRISFVVVDEGRVVLRPKNLPLSKLRGLLRRPDRRASLEDMDRGIREGAAARFRRATE